MKKEIIRLVYKNNIKKVGYVENNEYYTSRNDSHIFRMYNSVNISGWIINKLDLRGVKFINIKLLLNGQEHNYRLTTEQLKKCRAYKGYDGLQRIIPLDRIRVLDYETKQGRITDFLAEAS